MTGLAMSYCPKCLHGFEKFNIGADGRPVRCARCGVDLLEYSSLASRRVAAVFDFKTIRERMLNLMEIMEIDTNYKRNDLPAQTVRAIAADMTAEPYAHPKRLWMQP
jgi:hypothetical protein